MKKVYLIYRPINGMLCICSEKVAKTPEEAKTLAKETHWNADFWDWHDVFDLEEGLPLVNQIRGLTGRLPFKTGVKAVHHNKYAPGYTEIIIKKNINTRNWIFPIEDLIKNCFDVVDFEKSEEKFMDEELDVYRFLIKEDHDELMEQYEYNNRQFFKYSARIREIAEAAKSEDIPTITCYTYAPARKSFGSEEKLISKNKWVKEEVI